MKTFCLYAIILISINHSYSQLSYFGHINLPSEIITNAIQIESTPDGGLIIAGNYSNLSYNRNVFLKLDSNNEIAWVINQPNYSHPMGLLPHCFVASDGNYLFNESVPNVNPTIERESKISKFSPDGNLIWEYQHSTNQYNEPCEIIETADEIMMLVYSIENTGTMQITHFSLVKLSLQGDYLGSVVLDSLIPSNLSYPCYSAINTTNDNHILLAGMGELQLPNGVISTVNFINKVNSNGDLVWQYVNNPIDDISEMITSLIELPCGDIIGFGSLTTYAPIFNYYATAIRLTETGILINYNNTTDSLSHFWDGAIYNECGYLAIGNNTDDSVMPAISPPYLFGANDNDIKFIEHTFSLPIIASASGKSICKRQNGYYAILISLSFPNQVVFINGAELSTEEFTKKDNQVVVFPNPSNGIFEVSSLSNEPMHITILDQQGKQVALFELNELSSDNSFDMSEQATGVYFAHISQGENQLVKKLVVR